MRTPQTAESALGRVAGSLSPCFGPSSSMSRLAGPLGVHRFWGPSTSLPHWLPNTPFQWSVTLSLSPQGRAKSCQGLTARGDGATLRPFWWADSRTPRLSVPLHSHLPKCLYPNSQNLPPKSTWRPGQRWRKASVCCFSTQQEAEHMERLRGAGSGSSRWKGQVTPPSGYLCPPSRCSCQQPGVRQAGPHSLRPDLPFQGSSEVWGAGGRGCSTSR